MNEIKEQKRTCTLDNELLECVLNNCIKFLNQRNTLYIFDIVLLLEKALEGIESKKDLSDSEIEDIKRIRKMIRGL